MLSLDNLILIYDPTKKEDCRLEQMLRENRIKLFSMLDIAKKSGEAEANKYRIHKLPVVINIDSGERRYDFFNAYFLKKLSEGKQHE